MNKKEREEIGVVLLHGAGLGSWIWPKVVEQLSYPAIAIDFPGRGRGDSEHLETKKLTLTQYVESIHDDIERFKKPKVIIVAHSISGVLSVELAQLLQDRLVGFIAVGAAIPREQGSFLSALPRVNRVIMRIVLRLLGTKPPISTIQSGLCSDLNETTSMEVVKRFVPESRRLYTDKVRLNRKFRHSMYIRLTQDREFNTSMQQGMIANLQPDGIEELPSGHLPMLSMPSELATIINQYAAERKFELEA